MSENEAGWGINTTLTSTPDVFPVDQAIYLDMSHDSILVSVLTALGLDFLKEDLPSTKILAPRQFVLSRLTPFGARIYVEVLSCGEEEEEDLLEKLENTANEVADKPSRTRSDASESNKQKHRSEAVKRSTFVRIKVNNRVLPLNSLKIVLLTRKACVHLVTLQSPLSIRCQKLILIEIVMEFLKVTRMLKTTKPKMRQGDFYGTEIKRTKQQFAIDYLLHYSVTERL